MSVKVANSRFITNSLHRFGALYQHFSNSISVQQLGKKLIHEAELAQAFRHTDRLEELGSILFHFPLREYQIIGQYYLGWSKFRRGEDAQPVFENVIDQSKTYKTKGLISLGALMYGNRDFPSAVRYYTEALRTDNSPSVFVPIARTIAVIKATEGDHKQALKELERILPITRYTTPKSYYDYLNSYAVELGEAGRIEEAQNVCRITLASPFAFAYPEWRETEQDLALRGYKSRSTIRVKHIPKNLFYLPERSPVINRPKPGYLAPVVDYVEWKKKMVKEPNGDEELPEDMTVQQMAMKIIGLITQNKDDEDKLRDLLNHALKIYAKK
jgi:tetratricopeptide (TPR) repeat protein